MFNRGKRRVPEITSDAPCADQSPQTIPPPADAVDTPAADLLSIGQPIPSQSQRAADVINQIHTALRDSVTVDDPDLSGLSELWAYGSNLSDELSGAVALLKERIDEERTAAARRFAEQEAAIAEKINNNEEVVQAIKTITNIEEARRKVKRHGKIRLRAAQLALSGINVGVMGTIAGTTPIIEWWNMANGWGKAAAAATLGPLVVKQALAGYGWHRDSRFIELFKENVPKEKRKKSTEENSTAPIGGVTLPDTTPRSTRRFLFHRLTKYDMYRSRTLVGRQSIAHKLSSGNHWQSSDSMTRAASDLRPKSLNYMLKRTARRERIFKVPDTSAELKTLKKQLSAAKKALANMEQAARDELQSAD